MIGRTIRRSREAKGWSQQELADAASLSRRHISQIERGRTNASYEALSKIAGALGLDSMQFATTSANVVERIDRTIGELSAVRDIVAAREKQRADSLIPAAEDDDERYTELRALMGHIAPEMREPLLAILTKPFLDTVASVPLGAPFRMLVAVRQLLEAARTIDEASPSRALRFTDLALETISTLNDAQLAAAITHLTALCLRERAFYCIHNGRELEALDACERAEALFKSLGNFEYDVANVTMVRANALQKLNRYDEAVEVIGRAERVFADAGADEQLLKARITRAMALQSARQYAAAMELWLRCEEPAKLAGDAELYPIVLHGLAICYRNLGRLADSEAAYRQAIEIYRRIASLSRVAQAEWGMALTIGARGDHARAMAMLRDVQATFERFGMANNAIGAMLDIVELKLLAGERAGIADICRDLLERSARAGRSEDALRALAYLKEAAVDDRLSSRTIVRVREMLGLTDNR